MLELPDALVEEARRGRVVLLLGAGASKGSANPAGMEPPNGDQLRDLLADRFLGGKSKESPLAWVSELAISETDLGTVQEFIADLLRDLKPATFHEQLCSFRWRGIVTTNYDTLIEAIYASKERIQDLVPIRSDADKIDDLLRSPKDLALLKLHGCITRTRDPLAPFILTTDQYVTHRAGRAQLFSTMEEWGREHTVVFVGSSGSDPDIRELLLELSKIGDFRPRYYFVKPGVGETEKRLWEGKRISVLDASFADFLEALGRKIERVVRPLLVVQESAQPIRRRYVVTESVSSFLADSLVSDFEYVHESLAAASGTPADFYRGWDFGWYATMQKLDVRRKLTDRVLSEVILRAEGDRPAIAELYALKGEAGAGKTVLLRRVAWEAATDADVLCLYLRQEGTLRYDVIREIHRVTQQRIFVFVDNASKHVAEINYAITNAVRERCPLTCVTAERYNTWNVACERLVPLLTDEFALRYLSEAELGDLVDLLRKHDSLGDRLGRKSREECVREFAERAGRQLLVALHEATVGLPFEEIILNEYQELVPKAAQELYLTVCVLNRLRVGVRAGLISRVHNLPFEEFRRSLFAPLEHVVQAIQHPGTQDFLYVTRHPEIAQIVFDRVLNRPADRLNEYVRILGQLNLAYGTDRQALRGLLKARTLHDQFPNYEDVRQIFTLGTSVAPREAYVYQQRANYERIRPNGNMLLAESLLQKAKELDSRDLSIVHSLAELKRTRAETATHDLEKAKLRNECRVILQPLMRDPQHARYARVTLVKLAIDELREVLADETASDRAVDSAVRMVEEHLERAQQQFPDEQYLHTAEAEVGTILHDSERSFAALHRAFEANSRDTFIASRLARLLEDGGKLGEAKSVLEKALDGNRGDKHLNFQYGNILRLSGTVGNDVLVYHFRRAFQRWDDNYEAQFWFARFAFESSDARERQESKEVFRHLREVPIAFDVRVKVRDSIGNGTTARLHYGKVAKKEFDFGFVEVEGSGDWIFLHRRFVNNWDAIIEKMRVRFEVGFSFGGAVALNVSQA